MLTWWSQAQAFALFLVSSLHKKGIQFQLRSGWFIFWSAVLSQYHWHLFCKKGFNGATPRYANQLWLHHNIRALCAHLKMRSHMHKGLWKNFFDHYDLLLSYYTLTWLTLKVNTDTSGLVSGLVTIRSGDCGAKFKNVGNLKAILISSLYSYPEANLYQFAFAKHPDGFQFTIPNPDLNSVSISWSKSVSVYWFLMKIKLQWPERKLSKTDKNGSGSW